MCPSNMKTESADDVKQFVLDHIEDNPSHKRFYIEAYEEEQQQQQQQQAPAAVDVAGEKIAEEEKV